ncbi:MAG: hypothetical protein P8105_03475, partial [Dehalococcoidia bacterium]
MSAGRIWQVRRFKVLIRLLLCFIVVVAVLLATADSAAAATAARTPPEIIDFSADPMVLDDGSSTTYYFEVKNATNVQLVEAGEVIKEITNPPFTSCNGKAKGRTTYQIRTGSSNTFDALLVVWNSAGNQQRRLTLSFATEAKPMIYLIPPVSYEVGDDSQKPEWKEQKTAISPDKPA